MPFLFIQKETVCVYRLIQTVDILLCHGDNKMEDLQKMVAQMAEKQHLDALQQQRDETVEILIRVMSASYDKARTNANLIMIVGYASFFAVWGKLYEKLSPFWMSLSGALMISSVLVFIVWEIYKMIFYSTNLKDLYKITEEKNPDTFNKKLKENEISSKKRNLEQLKIWYLVLILTAIPGVSAGFILLYLGGSSPKRVGRNEHIVADKDSNVKEIYCFIGVGNLS